MKLLILLTLFTSSAFANFQKIEELKTCSVRTTCLRDCGEGYIKVPFGFVCEYNDLVKVFDDDYTKPINECTTDEVTQEETCIVVGYEKLETFRYTVKPNAEKKAAYDAELAKIKAAADTVAIGRTNRIKSQEAIDYIGGLFNEQSEEATDTLLASYGEVYQALSIGRRGKALRLLQALEVSEDQAPLKAQLIKILTIN